jgi:hypothetical protein
MQRLYTPQERSRFRAEIVASRPEGVSIYAERERTAIERKAIKRRKPPLVGGFHP